MKTGYPEEYVTVKSGYRKNTLHPKLATGRIHYTENWLPGKLRFHYKAAFSEEFCAALLKATARKIKMKGSTEISRMYECYFRVGR